MISEKPAIKIVPVRLRWRMCAGHPEARALYEMRAGTDTQQTVVALCGECADTLLAALSDLRAKASPAPAEEAHAAPKICQGDLDQETLPEPPTECKELDGGYKVWPATGYVYMPFSGNRLHLAVWTADRSGRVERKRACCPAAFDEPRRAQEHHKGRWPVCRMCLKAWKRYGFPELKETP